ncbi:hypothetical protein [Emticicia sp. C21]|uniref:hypothetical protein n=1 Tax=Emticicia sp. C21 TaxID=2302915 RepID=UPI0011C10738|nr:hypothetical protein [Emticicia sp. C21]
MRLLFFNLFILTSFFALGSCNTSTNKGLSGISTIPTDTAKGIIIKHSLPRGNIYNDPAGKHFAYGVFWASVINKTATPIELTMNFPADSFAISGQPKDYVKFFLPPGTMTPEKESVYDYGLTTLKSFLDKHFHEPSQLKTTIKPKEEYRFYIAVVSKEGYNGAVRAELVLKEQNLFYKINMLDSLLPCGSIVFKK